MMIHTAWSAERSWKITNDFDGTNNVSVHWMGYKRWSKKNGRMKEQNERDKEKRKRTAMRDEWKERKNIAFDINKREFKMVR